MTLKRDILVMVIIVIFGAIVLIPYYLFIGFFIIFLGIIPKYLWDNCVLDVLFTGKTSRIKRIKNAYPIKGRIYVYSLISIFLIYITIGFFLIFK